MVNGESLASVRTLLVSPNICQSLFGEDTTVGQSLLEGRHLF